MAARNTAAKTGAKAAEAAEQAVEVNVNGTGPGGPSVTTTVTGSVANVGVGCLFAALSIWSGSIALGHFKTAIKIASAAAE